MALFFTPSEKPSRVLGARITPISALPAATCCTTALLPFATCRSRSMPSFFKYPSSSATLIGKNVIPTLNGSRTLNFLSGGGPPADCACAVLITGCCGASITAGAVGAACRIPSVGAWAGFDASLDAAAADAPWAVRATASAKVADAIESLRCMVRPFALASSSPACHIQKCIPRGENDKPLLLSASELAVTPEHHLPVEVLHDAVKRQPQH